MELKQHNQILISVRARLGPFQILFPKCVWLPIAYNKHRLDVSCRLVRWWLNNISLLTNFWLIVEHRVSLRMEFGHAPITPSMDNIDCVSQTLWRTVGKVKEHCSLERMSLSWFSRYPLSIKRPIWQIGCSKRVLLTRLDFACVRCMSTPPSRSNNFVTLSKEIPIHGIG